MIGRSRSRRDTNLRAGQPSSSLAANGVFRLTGFGFPEQPHDLVGQALRESAARLERQRGADKAQVKHDADCTRTREGCLLLDLPKPCKLEVFSMARA